MSLLAAWAVFICREKDKEDLPFIFLARAVFICSMGLNDVCGTFFKNFI
jgi:hypothetical protein